MAIQDYNTALQNAVKSFNVAMRAACNTVSTSLGQTVTWYPEGAKPAVRSYPHVTAQFLRLGSYNARRQRLMSEVQIDIFTNDQHQADARRIAGKLLVAIGISVDNPLQFAEITQTDSESGYSLPLLPMDLILLRGFESLGDPDPSVTHLFSEFQLFHE